MGRRTRVGTGAGIGQGPALEDSTHDVDRSFPLVVALLSTIAAVALFVTGTIPALQEQKLLSEVEVERQQLHTGLWAELDAESTLRMALAIDLQSLMVELDKQGIYPGDLIPDGRVEPPPPGERSERKGDAPR